MIKLPPFPRVAPVLLGAILFLSVGCKDKDQADDWTGHQGIEVDTPEKEDKPTEKLVPVSAPTPPPEKPTETSVVDSDIPEENSGIRFISYNVQNWLTMDRYVDGKREKGAPKPETERMAITKLLVASRPDILGVSEVGTQEDVRDLQLHLEKAGHAMPHYHLTRGVDPTRSLAILSRFPIKNTVTHKDLTYTSNGRSDAMQRGILDATIDTPSGEFRFLGVHFKSKREIDDGDQADMRLNEAHLLRREVDTILEETPEARLVVYGDFNDTRQSPAIKAVRGKGAKKLLMIALKDSRGDYWTHHWNYQDVYSRIDYVLISGALRNSVEWDRCKVLDGEFVKEASDHRPLLVILR